MIIFRRLYITFSLWAGHQRGPYRSSNPCTDRPFPKPTVHSRHSCGTVEIVRESTYDGGGGGAEAEGERGSLSRGEVGIEWNDVAVVIEAGVAQPGVATRWVVFKVIETRPLNRSSNFVSILSSRSFVCASYSLTSRARL